MNANITSNLKSANDVVVGATFNVDGDEYAVHTVIKDEQIVLCRKSSAKGAGRR